VTDLLQTQREALGAFIREQRKRANLSLRQLAELTSLSNPYLSQVERGLHQPSVRVLKAISDALNLSAETLLAEAGLIDAMAGSRRGSWADPGPPASTEDAIRADQRLNDQQKAALIAVYRSMLGQPRAAGLRSARGRYPAASTGKDGQGDQATADRGKRADGQP
jgi:transcriptional regulator with XRE-family HTH domain